MEEKEFLIESPQGIVLAGKKRRKSMEPGKVKALNEGMCACMHTKSYDIDLFYF